MEMEETDVTKRVKGMRFSRLMVLSSALLALAVLVPAIVLADPGQGDPGQDDPLPPEKAAAIAREERLIAEARANPPPPGARKPPIPTAPPAYVPPEFAIPRIPAGAGTIIQNGQAPFPAAQYRFQNRWLETKGGKAIGVYAGRMGSDFDTSQGVVYIIVSTSGVSPQPFGGAPFLTPFRAGSVRVVGAEGERLTLTSETGVTFFFDVPTCAFVPANAPVLPPDPSCVANLEPPVPSPTWVATPTLQAPVYTPSPAITFGPAPTLRPYPTPGPSTTPDPEPAP